MDAMHKPPWSRARQLAKALQLFETFAGFSASDHRGASMPRVKRSVHAKKKRREVFSQAKGYRGARSRRYRVAKEQLLHSGVYAYRDRRDRKGLFRRLWITRWIDCESVAWPPVSSL